MKREQIRGLVVEAITDSNTLTSVVDKIHAAITPFEKEWLMELFNDMSEQEGDNVEHRIIRDNDFDELAGLLIKNN